MEVANIVQPSWNRHTSVDMIEKYCASHIKTRLDAAAINVRRPRLVAKDRDKLSSLHQALRVS
jgi:hypothetical protein